MGSDHPRAENYRVLTFDCSLGLDTVWIRREHTAARVVDAKPTWSYDTSGISPTPSWEDPP